MTIKSKGIVKDLIIVAIGVLAIWIGLQIIFGTPNPFYVVSSGSMIPQLLVYDVLVVNGNAPFEEVKVGDIIVFNRPSGHDRVIVHRVAAITGDDPYTLRTKGDANPASIPGTDFPITDEEYIGQVYTVIPQIGYVTQILQPPINYIIIAVIIGIMIFKQMSKKKSEKELTFSDTMDSNSPSEKNQSTFDFSELDEMPKDTSYTKTEESIQEPEKGNPDELKDEPFKKDRTDQNRDKFSS